MTQNWKEYTNNVLLSATGYSGHKDKGKKIISASSLGNEMLALYLDYKHGKQEDTKFEASNLGSVFHVGAEEIFKNEPNVELETRLEYELSNGWIVSGSIDMILHEFEMIVDWKVSTENSLKKIKSEGLNNGYALQLAVCKFLVHKNYNKDYEGALAFLDKKASYFKPKPTEVMNYLEVQTHMYDDIEELLIEKTNTLQEFIDNDMEPPKCVDLFPYKPKGLGGRTLPMKCIHWCSYNKNCKHYNEDLANKESIMGLNVQDTTVNPYIIDF